MSYGIINNKFLYLTGLKIKMMRKILLLIAMAITSYGYAQNDVTFKVDMNDYTGSFTEVQLNGTFNEWCGNCNPMTDDDMDGVWELTIPLEDASIEYKFTYDNWTGQESLTPGSPCTVTNGDFTNRYLEIEGDTVLSVVCWESCSTCDGVPTAADVTFQVDLSEYTGSYSMVNLNGTFNDWCGTCAVMTDDNSDDIYEITVNVLTNDSLEYKFTLDGWDIDEQLTEGSPCTITTTDDSGTFTNRLLVATSDSVLTAVCWEECVSCMSVGVEENNWLNQFTVVPNPSNTGIFTLKGELKTNTDLIVFVNDIQGKVVYQSSFSGSMIQERIDLSELEDGMYMITVSSKVGSKTEKVFINK